MPGPGGAEGSPGLVDLARLLDPDAGPGQQDITLAVPDGPPGDEDRRFLLLVGLFDELAEAACGALPSDALRREALADALSAIEALVPVLRFELRGLEERLRHDELTARMREREIRIHQGWLLPRLRRDVDAYERRIRALRAALREAG
ncbi:MAG TPA: hypothetical protein VNO79_01800 [Actinomycetota bacterium]|nr:hypothetical protein [Actinomycetota bacterium]